MRCTVEHNRGDLLLGLCLGRPYFGRSAEREARLQVPKVRKSKANMGVMRVSVLYIPTA